jgi:hypothetical protein
LRKLNDRFEAPDILPNSSRMAYLEESRLKEDVGRVHLHHAQVARQRGAHVVVVTKHFPPIACPYVMPDIRGIGANAIY